jgi:hypothetical protein
MENFIALESNKWLLNWFKTQGITIGDKKSTIILEMCQVKRGGIFPLILIAFYPL